MKTNKYAIYGIAMAGMMAMSSCSDILDEQPRSGYTPGFFATEDGVKGGLTALYSGLRDIYGQAYIYNSMETGTDEYTWAQSGNADQFKATDMTTNMTPSNCDAAGLWGESFGDLNTAFAVIENGEAANVSPALIAEARFFVGFHYFNLVQTFGGVPLDMGGGELHSNTSPKRSSVRNTVADVYTKAIIPYLTDAEKDLPYESRLPGTVNKTTARLVLAKACLTYAWWLKNPNNIPTYPECSRDASQANTYFQKAYDIAKSAYSDGSKKNDLEPYFYLANIAQNDRNKEWLLWADHTQESEQYNGGSLGYGGGGAPDNFAGWFVTWNYCGGWLQGKDNKGNSVNPCEREASQPLGRPWTRMAAVVEGLSKFTNTDKDSRWDGTFTAQYRINRHKIDGGFQYMVGAHGAQLKAYETFLKFLPIDTPNKDQIAYDANNPAQSGVMPGEEAYVIDVNWVSRSRWPGMWKLGPCRTDYDFNSALGSPNAGSTRPYAILKFSELYLVAAEAAVMLGKNTDAKEALKPLVERAGRWNYEVNEGDPAALFSMKGSDLNALTRYADYSKELYDALPATIDINFILDERLREFFGEGYRWHDLVRTQKWNEVAGKYTICSEFSLTKETITRNIDNHHYLRPIPQGQIDALEMEDAEKDAYQNPGYLKK